MFAEKNIRTSILQRALNAVRGFLRRFFPQLELSQGELRQMLWEAGQFLEGRAYRLSVAQNALRQPNPQNMTMRQAVQRYSFGKQGSMRTKGIPASIQSPISLWRNDQPLKAHASYKAAKAGDPQAAVDLIRTVAQPLAAQATAFDTDVIYIAPHAIEASGKNAIPATLAAYLAAANGSRLDTEIVQSNRAFHTGASAMERLLARSAFEGEVKAGAKYVMVDDVTTMGGTLADLASFIQENGGQVVGAVTLVNAARDGKLPSTVARQRMLEQRFGDEIRQQFQIDPAALTSQEAGYLAGFRDAAALRSRAASAAQERSERLRARGISEAESGVAADQQDPSQAPPSEGLGASGANVAKATPPDPAAKTQFEATARAYGGERTWQRAKDAGRTKLNYRQWVQVRTPAFKAWFGDWEALHAQSRLDAMEPVEVAIPERWAKFPLNEIRLRVKDALLSIGTMEHPEIGAVRVKPRGVKKAIAESADPAKLALLSDLKKAFGQSIFASAIAADGKPNVAAYEKLLARIKVGKLELAAVFSVERTNDGRQFYNTATLNDGKEKAPVASPRDTPENGERATSANTGAEDFVRRTLSRVNQDTVSKAVDSKTGEPQLTYHGTDAEFEAFDRRLQNRGDLGRDFYFTSAEEDAALFGENVGAYFLSIASEKDGAIDRGFRGIDTFVAKRPDGQLDAAALDSQQLDRVSRVPW